MNPASTLEFRENRARFTLAELLEYADQWVAFSADGKRIVASGIGLADVFNQLRERHENPQAVAFEHIVIETDEINLGGAEFL